MTVKERLIEYIKYKKISTREFCRNIGVSETYVNSMRHSIQPDKVAVIMQKYPDLSMQWLFTGEGVMIKQSELLPPIPKDKLIETGSDVFKDMLIDMFKKGEIFAASMFWEQQRIISEMRGRIEELMKENERLKITLAQHGINPL